ncbi:structural cement protein Gp24 [Labrys neptuniae]
MTAFQYRMPAGIPGAVTRAEQATVEPQLYDSTAPFTGYGLPGKIGTNGKFQPITTGDAAGALYGILVRPYPTNSSQDGLGVSVPPTSGACNVLRRGYMMAQVNGAAAATKNGQAYIRVAAAAAGKPIGGIEAAADSTNTIAPVGLVFTGPADANGNTELAYNI